MPWFQHHQRLLAELGGVHGDVAPQQLPHHALPMVAQNQAPRVELGCRVSGVRGAHE
jgi:hypothetical protein